MGEVIELVHCLCGDLMRYEPVQKEQIPICWKCACDSEAELERKLAKRRGKQC